MRILRAIVEPTTDLVAVGIADLFHRRGIRAKAVGDDLPRSAVSLHDPLEKLQRRSLVPLRSDDRFQNLAFMIDGAPQIDHAPIDFQIDLVKMPDRMRSGTALAQFRCNDRPEMIHPASDCFVRNCNSALREQILDVTKAEREPQIESNRLMYDLSREPISGVADFPHTLGYSAYAHPTRCGRRDKAVATVL